MIFTRLMFGGINSNAVSSAAASQSSASQLCAAHRLFSRSYAINPAPNRHRMNPPR